jgi:hypothetical protein
MPLNYLQLQPQIEQYTQFAILNRKELESRRQTAMELLRSCGRRHAEIRNILNGRITSLSSGERYGLLGNEPADSAIDPDEQVVPYLLLTSDGS